MVWVTNLTLKKMEKNVLCKYDGKEIYSESELLQKICDKLTYGFGTQYVDVDEINEVSILENCYSDLENHLEKISTLMDSIENRLSEIDGDDED